MKFFRSNVYLLTVLFLLYALVILEVVAIPSIATTVVKEMGIDPSKITMISSGFNLGGLLAPFFGYYGDKIGKKKSMIFGIILFIIGTFLTSNVDNFTQYIFARAITGLGYFAFISLLFAYIADFIPYDKRGRISGMLKVVFALVVLAAPMYSAFVVSKFSFLYIYRFISIAGAILLLFLFTLPESKSQEAEKMNLKTFKNLLFNKDSLKFIIVMFLITIPGMMFFSYVPFQLDSLGLNQFEISTTFTTIGIGTLGAGLIVIFLSDKIGKMRLLRISFLVSIFGMLFLTSGNIIVLVGFAIFFLLGFDTIHGLYFTVVGEIFVNQRATFISLLGMTMALSQFILSLTAPIINRLGGYSLNIMVAIGALCIAAYIFYGLYHKFKDQLN